MSSSEFSLKPKLKVDLAATILSVTTLSIMGSFATLSILGFFATLNKSDTQLRGREY